MKNEEQPTVLYEGIMNVGDHQIRVYHLSNGKRVINGEDLENFFGKEDWQQMQKDVFNLNL